MDDMSIEAVKIKAFVVIDKVHNVYTVFTKGLGGPIISDKDHDVAMKKFERALNLSCAINNVSFLQSVIGSNLEQKKKYVLATSHNSPKNIEYVNVGG